MDNIVSIQCSECGSIFYDELNALQLCNNCLSKEFFKLLDELGQPIILDEETGYLYIPKCFNN
jgi:DNA-directed RNA polymerase subunit RPC12/RpoP